MRHARRPARAGGDPRSLSLRPKIHGPIKSGPKYPQRLVVSGPRPPFFRPGIAGALYAHYQPRGLPMEGFWDRNARSSCLAHDHHRRATGFRGWVPLMGKPRFRGCCWPEFDGVGSGAGFEGSRPTIGTRPAGPLKHQTSPFPARGIRDRAEFIIAFLMFETPNGPRAIRLGGQIQDTYWKLYPVFALRFGTRDGTTNRYQTNKPGEKNKR